jgi:hypothetical protein
MEWEAHMAIQHATAPRLTTPFITPVPEWVPPSRVWEEVEAEYRLPLKAVASEVAAILFCLGVIALAVLWVVAFQ